MDKGETKKCQQCDKEFLITSLEQKFYEKKSLAAPSNCPKCRRDRRRGLRNKRKLFTRTCDKCGTSLKSTYPQESRYKIYCEKCYLESI
jgi:Zn ribbon nucleic-acid-binding protein